MTGLNSGTSWLSSITHSLHTRRLTRPIERTVNGVPPPAAHRRRWARTNPRPMQRLSPRTFRVRRDQATAQAELGCSSVGEPLTFGALATTNVCFRSSRRSVLRRVAPLRTPAAVRIAGLFVEEPSSTCMPNPAFERTSTGEPASAAQGAR